MFQCTAPFSTITPTIKSFSNRTCSNRRLLLIGVCIILEHWSQYKLITTLRLAFHFIYSFSLYKSTFPSFSPFSYLHLSSFCSLFLLFNSPAITCPTASSPANGEVTATGNTYGSSARYTCNSGYRLVGEAIAVCQLNGRWSSSAPTCQCTNCGLVRGLNSFKH